MSEAEYRPNTAGLNRRNKNVNLSSALAIKLGIPTDVIERAIVNVLEENTSSNVLLPSSSRNSYRSIRGSEPVDESSPDSNNEVRSSRNFDIDSIDSRAAQKNRKGQVDMLNEQDIPNKNLNHRPPYYDEQNISNRSNNEVVTRNRADYAHDFSNNSLQQRESFNKDTYKSLNQNRQVDSTFDEYVPLRLKEQDNYRAFTFDTQNQKIDTNISKDFTRRQRSSLQTTTEIQSRQVDSISNFPEENIRPQYRQVQESHKSYSQVVSPKKNNSETYKSEFPSLSEASKWGGDSKKNSEVDLGAWGHMDVNITSPWSKSKRWPSESEVNNAFEPPPAITPTWNSNEDYTWKANQEPKALTNKKKPTKNNYDYDDNEGWGAPPTKYIPWDDSRQGYCVDLIEEQRETIYWSQQNGEWVNVSEECLITSEKKTIEYSSDGNQKNIRETRTQRFERQDTRNSECTENNMIIELSDHSNDNSESSEVEDFRSKHDRYITTDLEEDNRERLGNPRWKTKDEWHNDGHNDLISLDIQDTSESKGSEEQTLIASNGKDENDNLLESNEEASNWGDWTKKSTETIADDAWFDNEVEGSQKDAFNQNVLINIDTNNDNVAIDSTIINTHPPIYHGKINNEMANLNDILFDSDDISENVNDDLNLLSFDEDENKIGKKSGEQQLQDNDSNVFDVDGLEDFLEHNKHEHSEVIKSSNELSEKAPVTSNITNDNLNDKLSPLTPPSKSYRCEDSLQDEVIESSTIDHNSKDHKNEESVEPQVVTSDDPEQNPTKTDTNDDKNGAYIISLTVETPSSGKQTLRLRIDDDPQKAAREFCEKWDMVNFEDALIGFVTKNKKKRVKRINKMKE